MGIVSNEAVLFTSIQGCEIGLINKLYSSELRANRVKNGKGEIVHVKTLYPNFDMNNAFIVSNLREAKASDLRTDRELPESEWERK